MVATTLAAATTLATLCFAPYASAAALPAPPAQAVKMGQEQGTPLYGQAYVVNDAAAHPAEQWYAAGPGSTNSTAFTDYVIRTGTGRYRVWLPGLGSHGAAVVTEAAGAAPGAYCVISDVVAVADRDVPGTDIVVSCHGELGLAPNSGTLTGGTLTGGTTEANATDADATFTLAYSYLGITDLRQPPRPGEPSAYLRATRPAAGSYMPDLAYQYHVTGGNNVVDRMDAGDYRVRLPGLETLAGSRANVTGYGPGNHRCEIESRVVSATTLVVGIRCRTAEGAPADVPFIFAYGGTGT
jgi:hypothetical protein